MTNKIVILDNSVELYEHYINDEKWEKTVSFPKGGLTFNISNGTIKFFAFEDYLYRNCIISMQLPIYIVDRDGGIDGEYDDISEIGEILDRIFPNASGTEIDLSAYLKKREAAALYQPIGDYALKSEIPDVTDFVTDEDLVEALDDYYTKDEVDGMIPSLSGYATTEYVSGYTYDKSTIDEKIAQGGTFDPTQYYTKTATDALLDEKLDATAYTPADLSNYYTKSETDDKLNKKVDTEVLTLYYTKDETDDKFLEKTAIPELNNLATKTWVNNQNFINSDTLSVYLTNIQQQINSLQESIETCCSIPPTPETIYRWVTSTVDFVCSGTTKYYIEQKQQSTDNGATWTDVQGETRISTTPYPNSRDCGYQDAQMRWVEIPDTYTCDGNYCRYHVIKLQYSYDSGSTWVDSNPLQTAHGSLVSCKNYDCGYSGCMYCADVRISGSNETYHPETWVEYNEELYGKVGLFDTNTTSRWTKVNGINNFGELITSVTLNNCVVEIGENTFEAYWSGDNFYNLRYVDLPSSVTKIGRQAFNLHGEINRTFVIRATTPPTLSSEELETTYEGYTFPTRMMRIYVPDESVDLYKNAERWFRYKDRIYPLSSLNS